MLTSFSLIRLRRSSQAPTTPLRLAYDKTIFDITQNVNLIVPKSTTTRPRCDQPTDLFQSCAGTNGREPLVWPSKNLSPSASLSDKANAQMVAVVGGGRLRYGFLSGGRQAVFSQNRYQARVISAKETGS